MSLTSDKNCLDFFIRLFIIVFIKFIVKLMQNEKEKMTEEKKQEREDQCYFLVQVPRQLRLDFREACHKQSSTARNAIILLMKATIDGSFTFNRSLKIRKTKRQ